MAPLIAMLMSIGIASVFGMLALSVGFDSRPGYGDDHVRQ